MIFKSNRLAAQIVFSEDDADATGRGYYVSYWFRSSGKAYRQSELFATKNEAEADIRITFACDNF